MPKYKVLAEMYRKGVLYRIGDVIDVDDWGTREVPVRNDDGTETGETKTVHLKPSKHVREINDDGTEPAPDKKTATATGAAAHTKTATATTDKHVGPFTGARATDDKKPHGKQE